MNTLYPLAKVLLEVGVTCPKAVEQFYGPQHDAVTEGQFRREHQGCSLCGGTGKVWPEWARWLAEQVLKPCSDESHKPHELPYLPTCLEHGGVHHCHICHGAGWVPKDSTDYPKGWAKGMLDSWYWSLPPGKARDLIAIAMSNAENSVRNPAVDLDRSCIEDMAIMIQVIVKEAKP